MDLYISNLSINVTEDELKEIFSQFGHVSHVVVLKDPLTNNPLGAAVVTMPGKTQANEAINKLNFTRIKERKVLVGPAASTGNRRLRPRPESDS